MPEFELSPVQAAESINALAAATSGALLQYLTASMKIERPVDEWLYGLARVRPMAHAWKAMLMLAGALGRPEPDLVPIQFPHDPGAPWLAMQFPDTYALVSDHDLYTAHYAVPFDAAARQCGLLLDEWTEVVPGTSKHTGLTFHFDRPDNEPPQSILLVVPATADGAWHWEDLVGALHETLDLARVGADDSHRVRSLPARHDHGRDAVRDLDHNIARRRHRCAEGGDRRCLAPCAWRTSAPPSTSGCSRR